MLATMLSLAAGLALPCGATRAQDATWVGSTSGDFNTASNWDTSTVPTGTAFFGTSSTTNLSFSTATTVGGWTFNAGSSNYNFTSGQLLNFDGAGIVINGGSATITNNWLLYFNDNSAAGSANITNNASLGFNSNSSAGNAVINNNDLLYFYDASTAGSASVNNNGLLSFYGTSSAAGASITNNGNLNFNDSSSAGSAAIINSAGKTLNFNDASTAGSASISNNGSLYFKDTSTAGDAIITTNNGGTTYFLDSAGGGTARVILNGTGALDISGLATDGTTVGSIEGNGIVRLGAKDLAVGGNDLSTTFSGSIQNIGIYGGSGGALTKTGTGTLTLTGVNTYSGGTVVDGGLINFNSVKNFGSGAITLDGGGLQWATGTTTDISSRLAAFGSGGATLDTNGNNVTLASGLSGVGALTKTGVGALRLTGANSYSGDTIVSAGRLQIGNGGTSGSIAGNVVDHATFAFDRSDAYTYAGTITGNGAVVQNGTGTTILTGTNSYNGGTTIASGTLQLGNGGTSGSIAGNVVDNGTLAFDRSDSYLFAGTTSGSGAVEQNGSGTTILTAAHTYIGDTYVNGGTLSVDGSIAASSQLIVNSGGTVGGTGILPSTIIASGGTLAPGNSVGTLTVNGNLAFDTGSVYAVQLSSSADRVDVTGAAALAGSVNVALIPGSSIAREYTILSAAGGLGGSTFNAISTGNLSPGLSASLSYTTTDALLTLTSELGANQGINGTQRNVANAIDGFFNDGGILPAGFVPLYGFAGGDLANALSQVSGEAATGAQQDAFELINLFFGLMLDRSSAGGGARSTGNASAFAARPAALPDEVARAYAAALKAAPSPPMNVPQRWSAWTAGFGGYNSVDGDAAAGTHDIAMRAYGGAAGLDYRVSPDTLIGLALAGAGTNWNLEQGLGGGRSDDFLAGLYGNTHLGDAYLAAALAFASHWMSTDRYAFGGDHLTADFAAYGFGGRIEGGYRLGTLRQAITPYAALQAQRLHTPDYSESDPTAGGFGLSYAANDATDARSELGARFDRRMAVATDATVHLSATLAWAHDWVSDPSLTAGFQALPGTSFIIDGAVPPGDSALVSAAAELRLANGVSLLAKFDTDLAAGAQTYSGSGTLRYSW